MNVYFDIHGLFGIRIENIPQEDLSFLQAEMGYFSTDKIEKPDLTILYRNDLKVSQSATRLLPDLFYDDGKLYLTKDGLLLSYDVTNLKNEMVRIVLQPGFQIWWLFWCIEKTMQLAVIRKGYIFLHTGAIKNSRNYGATVVTGLQGGGKTLYVLNEVDKGAGFLADELLLINKQGECFCYPRRVNFNRHHGIYFQRARKKRNQSNSRKLFLNPLLGWVYRVRGYGVSDEDLVREKIEVVFNKCKIVNSDMVKHLILLLPSNEKSERVQSWKPERVSHFLIQNARFERHQFIHPYLSAFYTFGDSYAMQCFEYLKELYTEEEIIVNSFINKVVLKIIFTGMVIHGSNENQSPDL